MRTGGSLHVFGASVSAHDSRGRANPMRTLLSGNSRTSVGLSSSSEEQELDQGPAQFELIHSTSTDGAPAAPGSRCDCCRCDSTAQEIVFCDARTLWGNVLLDSNSQPELFFKLASNSSRASGHLPGPSAKGTPHRCVAGPRF